MATRSAILGTSPAITTQLDDNNAGTIEAWIFAGDLAGQGAIIRQGADAGGFALVVNEDGSVGAFSATSSTTTWAQPPAREEKARISLLTPKKPTISGGSSDRPPGVQFER